MADTATAPPTGTTADERDARAIINDLLGQYGLASLSDWAWGEITTGATAAQIEVDMRSRPEFLQRFKGYDQLAKQGNAVSPAEWISYERNAAQLLKSAGLPPEFYSRDNVAKLIVGQVGLPELADRVNNAFVKMAYAPPEAQQAFQQYFGARGPHALAAMFLDPDVGSVALERQVQAAIIGGTAHQAGIDLGLADANRLADTGVSEGQAQQGFSQLGKILPLFTETAGEAGQQDLSAEKQGLGATFLGDAAAARQVQQRLGAREAAFSGGGGAYSDTRGEIGLSSEKT